MQRVPGRMVRFLRHVLDAGKWCKHVDAWDCLENQEFPSLEGFAFVAQQMFQLGKPPNRYTPEYMILKKYKEWEIRRYISSTTQSVHAYAVLAAPSSEHLAHLKPSDATEFLALQVQALLGRRGGCQARRWW